MTAQAWWGLARREPYRILFPLGMLFALHGVGHWLMLTTGLSRSASGAYHAFVQIAGYLYCFIAGFLLTALPRFTGAAPATTGELGTLLGLLTAQVAASAAGAWAAATAAHAGLLLLLIIFAVRRFGRRRAGVSPPDEFVWIPISLLLGLVGTGLLIAGQAGWLPVWAFGIGRPMAQQGFVLGIVLGIGGFMVPRLLGRVPLQVAPAEASASDIARLRAKRRLTHLAAGGCFAASFVIEGLGPTAAAYGVRAAVVTGMFLWTSRFHRPPSTRDAYILMLWASVWLMAAGFWGAAVMPQYRVPMLHLVFLGGISLMIFAVATMVVLSHAGEGWRLQRPLWVLRVVSAGVATALVARLAADVVPAHYFRLLGVAAAAWMAAGAAWLAFALPLVLRTVTPEALERLHEEAKRRVLHPKAC